MVSTRTLLVFTLCLAASTLAAAADTVTRIDGEEIVGEVTHIDSKSTVDVRSASGVVRVPSTEVLSVRFGGRDWTSPRGGVDLVVLSSGERWLVALESDVKAQLACASGKLLEGRNVVAFADVRAYVPRLAEGLSEAEREKLPVEMRERARAPDPNDTAVELLALENDRDVVLLWTGDQMTGVVESLETGHVVVSSKVGRVTVERRRLRGIAFSKTFKPWVEPGGILAEVRLNDGSVVLGQVAGPDADGGVTLHSVLGASWKTTLGAMRSVELRGGKLVWLSDVVPSRTSTAGFFNRAWEPRMNRSVWGGSLTVAGVTCEHGVGCHARTELEYDLDGKYVLFVSAVGIDDETKGTGSALFSVAADGRALLAPVLLKGREKAKPLKLNVAGVRRLTLTVDFGAEQDFGDHVDLLDARLIRK